MIRHFIIAALSAVSILGCIESAPPTSDDIQRQQQELLLQEGTSQVGMPSIKNFRERKMMKEIIELRDQAGFNTYTYLWSEETGRKIFVCNSIGYGLPYSTQFTNPQKVQRVPHAGGGYAYYTLPQADPNGLFSPTSADGTWVMCKNPKGTDVKPVFFEPKVIVSPFELPESEAESCGLSPVKK